MMLSACSQVTKSDNNIVSVKPDKALHTTSKDINLIANTPYVEIVNTDALAIIEDNAKINILGTGYAWSEGPVWLPQENKLLFSDVTYGSPWLHCPQRFEP